ncbi:MAG: MerR family transcriptional regulator [Tumebacillaceae bacterium]
MISISKVAEQTGLSTHTLRYYEKLGLLQTPSRTEGGVRSYTEEDVNFILFLKSLKATGMSLEDMQEFVRDGCVWSLVRSGRDVEPSLHKRITILVKHLEQLKQQQAELQAIIDLTETKIGVYQELLTTHVEE